MVQVTVLQNSKGANLHDQPLRGNEPELAFRARTIVMASAALDCGVAFQVLGGARNHGMKHKRAGTVF